MPSWPKALLPQQSTAPASVSAHVWRRPVETCQVPTRGDDKSLLSAQKTKKWKIWEQLWIIGG
eukprot:8237965-Pyramimonas_sp.AAC.2